MDLSFSRIVDEIQGENIKAADILNEIALRDADIKLEIEKYTELLNNLESERRQLAMGIENVLLHIKKNKPLIIQRKKYIILIDDNGISIQENVI